MTTPIDKDNATLIGYTRLGKAVYCPDNAKHVYISSTTGGGKTTAELNFVKHCIEKGIGLLLVDGKGDTGQDTMYEITKLFCEKYSRPLYLINMNDPHNSTKYNPLKNATETVAKDMLVNMSPQWSEEFYKTNFERYIQRVVKLMNIAEIPLSFKTIIHNMSTDNFESLSAVLQKSGLISKDSHIENLDLIKISGKIAEQALPRFATIAESEMGEIFDESGIDIYSALQEGAVVLFVLNPLIYPETSQAMGRLILIDSKKAVSRLFGGNSRYFFIFDEINVYASPVLIDLINKSRSAGVTCICATQSLADLEAAAGEAFKRQLIESVNNFLVMRQNAYSSAEEWSKTLGTQEKMQLTYQINEREPTGMGTAKRVREFIIHPDEIKSFKTGEGVFLSRDNGKCEKIKVVKPF